MKVDKHHPMLQDLMYEVSGAGVKDAHTIASRALPLQRRLVETVTSLAKPFTGELVLIYHKFQMRGRGIDRPVTDYWVRVARLPLQELKVVDLQRRDDKEIKPSGHRLTDFKPRFLIQVVWQRPLYPLGSEFDTRFVFERRRDFRAETPKPGQALHHFDISPLEDHLFQSPVVEDRRRKSKVTQEVAILLGTEEIKKWLSEHSSLATFQALVVPKKTVV